MNIIVIGCGVSGLSSGIRLLEAGHAVTIWARDLPPNTTSNVAAAIWYPYKAFPQVKVLAWGRRAFDVFCDLAGERGTGVTLVEGYEVFRKPVPDPWWRECVRTFRRILPYELPPGRVDGYAFETPVIEMSLYLDYLMARFRQMGGDIQVRAVRSLNEPLALSPLVINCAGLGSRELLGDTAVYPIRGQIVRVEPLSTRRFVLDEDEGETIEREIGPGDEVEAGGVIESEESGVTYIVPRSGDCVLGGTAQPNEWSLEPDMAVAASIIERCARFMPEVRGTRVLSHAVGLRPGRHSVRLEAETLPGGVVVHNYGHGGAGVTLSWGCAEEVASLVAEYIGV